MRRSTVLTVLAGGSVLPSLLAGCASPPGAEADGPARRIALAEFVSDPASAPADPADAPKPADRTAPTPARATTVDPAAVGSVRTADLTADEQGRPMALSAAPNTRRAQPVHVGDTVHVDSFIGQLNGQPVFADQFLAPIEDQLIAMATRLTGEQWHEQARIIIREKFIEEVMNALYLAEAESNLTPEQRMGLFAWMQQVEEGIIAQHQGSREAAEQELDAEQGRTLQETVQSTRNRALIAQLFRDRIQPRAIVSWRDVERAYERRFDEFNPPGNVTVGRVTVPTSDVSRIDDVRTRFASGATFAEVAEEYGEPVWHTLDVGPDGIESSFSAQFVLDALKELEHEGDYVGPEESGSMTWWIGIVSENRPEPHSLYDPVVQRTLYNQLLAQRMYDERTRFAESLIDDTISKQIGEMQAELVRIAWVRYAPR